jgi:hypothetical protein
MNHSGLKRVLSFLLLFVFLFPFVEKGVHGLSHRNDTHCTATSKKHFHAQQHDCSICDFTVAISSGPLSGRDKLTRSFTLLNYSGFSIREALPPIHPALFLRGPPQQS